jgi:hypothetical protein
MLLRAALLYKRRGNLENYPHEHLAPYKEFKIGANTYYFTPGGFICRKDHGRGRRLLLRLPQ